MRIVFIAETDISSATLFQTPECMIRFLHLVLLFPMSMATGFCANWYLDGAAAGANNGTSWADAWNNPTNIAWVSVNPGDVIYVSGGTTSQVYYDDLVFGKDGTAGNWITVRIGQDVGHNGVAIFSNAAVTMTSSPQWCWIDGGRSASFVGPTNHTQVITGATAITNNIGFRFINKNGPGDQAWNPTIWYFTRPNNLRFSYIEVSGLTNNNHPAGTYYGTICNGNIRHGVYTTNITFEYLYIHDNHGSQWIWSNAAATNFDNVVWKFGCMILNTEDNFQISGGWTIRDSVIGQVNGESYHVDLFQMTGDCIKIYNNDVRESQNSILRVQTFANDQIFGLRHDFWFFNNLVTEKLGRAPGGGTGVEPFCHVNFDPEHPGLYTTYSNIVYANNLFYNSVPNTLQREMCRNPMMFWNRGDITNAYIQKCLFVNNLVVDKEKGVGFPVLTNYYAYGFMPFTTNDFIMNYNVMAATNTILTAPRRIAYLDSLTNLEFSPYLFLNKTNYPVFTDKANDNFELLPTDTVALNTGTNLSALFNFDSLNRPRNVGGAWDRGPLEYQGIGSTGTR